MCPVALVGYPVRLFTNYKQVYIFFEARRQGMLCGFFQQLGRWRGGAVPVSLLLVAALLLQVPAVSAERAAGSLADHALSLLEDEYLAPFVKPTGGNQGADACSDPYPVLLQTFTGLESECLAPRSKPPWPEASFSYLSIAHFSPFAPRSPPL
ncbi:hypothetical protein DESUT3_07070 [Desulfuromonas versatilis]|uniref:Uncharacterized protein n=1 Tax=Desulfuromonas versatilis TaxID=2802975 RepID=A0ABN6DU30_9BACT|nr:hypothetical protein [Desulfuromonas versatilis]BCR03638.1 hypothetical protein DESUT3_07070 [Desulfuromonas versatilis]